MSPSGFQGDAPTTNALPFWAMVLVCSLVLVFLAALQLRTLHAPDAIVSLTEQTCMADLDLWLSDQFQNAAACGPSVNFPSSTQIHLSVSDNRLSGMAPGQWRLIVECWQCTVHVDATLDRGRQLNEQSVAGDWLTYAEFGHHSFPFDLREARLRSLDVLIEARSDAPMSRSFRRRLQVYLAPQGVTRRVAGFNHFFDGVIVGALGALTLYNLIILTAYRRRIQAYYCGACLATLTIAFLQFWGGIVKLSWGGFFLLLVGLLVSFMALFMAEFIGEDSVPRRARTALRWAGLVNALIAVMALLTRRLEHARVFENIQDICLLLTILPAVGLAFFGTVRGNHNARLFLLAWSPATLVGVATIVNSLRIYNLPPLGLDKLLNVGIVFALSLLGVGMADQIRVWQHQRDQAQRSSRRYHTMAYLDPLTGIANRRQFDEIVAGLKNTSATYALAIIDIDHFKSVNDSLGHDVGDQVLARVAQTIERLRRAGDTFARIGGEEFVLLMRDVGVDDAQEIADRLRGAIESADLGALFGLDRPVTVSIGISHVNHGERSFDAVQREADQALYRAKQAGRNQVVASA